MKSNIKNNNDVSDLMPARMLNEFVYCPRLFYIEWVESTFEDSADTIKGKIIHKSVDSERGSFSAPEDNIANDQRIHSTSVLLSGPNSGLIANIDLLEGTGIKVSPVEYKKGETPKIAGNAWLSDKIQVCAEALILKENGYECSEGVIYYAASKQKVIIKITEDLIKYTQKMANAAREVARSGNMPPPLKDNAKCLRCSLAGICLPDETNSLILTAGNIAQKDIRRLYPARDDALPVYVQEQGAYVSKKMKN
jgi:CRISPR-associated protein Cas1